MLFSIVVPVYNVESYLGKCVSSLLAQPFFDYEILLIDDGSTDKSGLMCDSFESCNARIRTIHQKNRGLSGARNTGINEARGDYVLFVDSDDYVDEGCLDKLRRYADGCTDVIVYDGVVEGNPRGIIGLSHINKKDFVSGELFLEESLSSGKCPMAAWLYCYRREFLVSNHLQFKERILHEDEQFTPRALLLCRKLVNTNFAIYHYQVREGSITTNKNKINNMIDLYGSILELEKIYLNLSNKKLRALLLNHCVSLYLNMFSAGEFHKFGKTYCHKGFVVKYSYSLKNRLKALVFCISPCYYNFLNRTVRKWKC